MYKPSQSGLFGFIYRTCNMDCPDAPGDFRFSGLICYSQRDPQHFTLHYMSHHCPANLHISLGMYLSGVCAPITITGCFSHEAADTDNSDTNIDLVRGNFQNSKNAETVPVSQRCDSI